MTNSSMTCAGVGDEHALAATNNPVLKSATKRFADGVLCGECRAVCVQWANSTTDGVHTKSTLSDTLTCSKSSTADVQRTNWTVFCVDSFFITSLSVSSAATSLEMSASTTCTTGAFNATAGAFFLALCARRLLNVCGNRLGRLHEVPQWFCPSRRDGVNCPVCVEYNDGVCEQCVDTIVKYSAMCVSTDRCSALNNGVCLRWANEMFPRGRCLPTSLAPESYTQHTWLHARPALSTRHSAFHGTSKLICT